MSIDILRNDQRALPNDWIALRNQSVVLSNDEESCWLKSNAVIRVAAKA